MQKVDLVLRNAKYLDADKREFVEGDIAIKDGKIVGINGKTGRTIKEVGNDNREQVAKTYKPGNYIPRIGALHVSDNPLLEEDGLHQQDDDRVRIVVTPPTGIATYTVLDPLNRFFFALTKTSGSTRILSLK